MAPVASGTMRPPSRTKRRLAASLSILLVAGGRLADALHPVEVADQRAQPPPRQRFIVDDERGHRHASTLPGGGAGSEMVTAQPSSPSPRPTSSAALSPWRAARRRRTARRP